jgi:hypothetical protein
MINIASMKTIRFLPVILILYSTLNCSKKDNNDDIIEPVAITYKAKININAEGYINDLVSYNEIVGYDTNLCAFLIEGNAANRINGYFFVAGGLPFMVKVNGKEIYSGLFFPSYSSNTPCGFLVEPVIGSNNTMYVRLDYGLCISEGQLVDNRNDQRLIAVLANDNKIITLDN